MAAVLDSVRAFFAPTTFAIDAENPSDVVARENLLDRVMMDAPIRAAGWISGPKTSETRLASQLAISGRPETQSAWAIRCVCSA